MKAVVRMSNLIFCTTTTNSMSNQVLFSFVLATALAKPQYGSAPLPASPAQEWAAPAPAQSWSPAQSSPAPQWPGAAPSSAPAVTAEQWASLNPYGSNSGAYPAGEQSQIEEIQRQWAKFLPYLPWLRVYNKCK